MKEKRPNPDEILEQIRREDTETGPASKKGRLKVFLGYSAGVGKTYRMLQEAGKAKADNIDVVVGIVETHKREETQKLLSGLEVIPRKVIDYKGITLEETDVDAILLRKPELVLMDELAHTNAPGSRHEKRYQDVEEFLNAGIDVYTTMNIQHLESMVDIVYQISGVRVGETVPDKMFDLAQEVELVDITPEKLIERLKEGKVYIPKKAEQAMKQFFKKGNLLALRELSLSYTAKQVNEDVRDYMAKYAVQGPWPVGARVMVGMSPSPNSKQLLRFTHRMAQDLNADWFAVFVRSPQQIKMNANAQLQMDKNVRLAEELGAMVVLLNGTDVAEEMLSFARTKNVTLIVAGPSERTWFEKLTRGSVLDKLMSKSGNISVLIAGSGKFAEKESEEKYTYAQPLSVKQYLLALLIIAASIGLGLLFKGKVDPLNMAMSLLVPAIACGIFWGVRVGLFASIVTIAALDFFFIPPYLQFRVSDIRYLPSFAVFFLVSFITSFLARSVRMEAEGSMHRERFIYSLYAFSKTIMEATALDDMLDRAVKSIGEAFDSHVVIFVPGPGDGLKLSAKDDENITLSQQEEAVAAWVYGNGQPAGRNTGTLSSVAWKYLPLKVQDKTVGVVGLKCRVSECSLTPEQEQLFESFAGVVALAVAKATK